jgi:hypothetical protein
MNSGVSIDELAVEDDPIRPPQMPSHRHDKTD